MIKEPKIKIESPKSLELGMGIILILVGFGLSIFGPYYFGKMIGTQGIPVFVWLIGVVAIIVITVLGYLGLCAYKQRVELWKEMRSSVGDIGKWGIKLVKRN